MIAVAAGCCAARGQVRGPSVVLMDVPSGNVLFSAGDRDVMSTPGSALKLFVLMAALDARIIDAHQTIACRGSLVVAGHNLACSHPRDVTVLDARQALAESCNSYFAKLAQRMPDATLANGLRKFGVMPARVSEGADARVLLALGMQGVAVSPRGLAEAYRKMALRMDASGDEASRVVADGMVQSVLTGMAHAARIDGMMLGGKTGTVDDGGGRSHGWFAGIVFSGALPNSAKQVLVVYMPNGNGNDAATFARQVLISRRSIR